jgi:hypothetical protein
MVLLEEAIAQFHERRGGVSSQSPERDEAPRIWHMMMMNSDDEVMFQQAMQLANSGQKDAAYNQLNAIRFRGNQNNPDLLLWIAFTTPYQTEAQQALDSVTAMAPDHPGLAGARQDYMQRYQPPQQQYMAPPQQYVVAAYAPLGPVLHCPYCHAHAPVLIQQRISTAGWVLFAVLLFITLIFCWVGLLIKENYYVCSRCGMKLS